MRFRGLSPASESYMNFMSPQIICCPLCGKQIQNKSPYMTPERMKSFPDTGIDFNYNKIEEENVIMCTCFDCEKSTTPNFIFYVRRACL